MATRCEGTQPAVPVIGFLNATSRDSSLTLEPFLQGLKESGFVEGQNVIIEYRWADGQYDRLPGMAADLVNRRVAVIAAIGGPLPAIAAKAATPTIPIVFQGGGDPIRLGVVASLNHPGSNITGAFKLTGGTTAKAVQFLREVVPIAASLGVLVNRSNYPSSTEAEAAARDLRWESQVFEASTDYDLKMAFETMAKQKIGAVIVVPDPFFTNRRFQIVALAAQYAIPASYMEGCQFIVDDGMAIADCVALI